MLRAQRGDARAYEELVRPHQEIAFRVAYVITRNAADAEDAIQDALVKAWRALGRFRAGEPLRPWLLQIVANEARNRRRSAGRREHLALRVLASSTSSGEAAPSPEEATLDADERARLLAALEQLSDDGARGARLPLPARALRGGDRRGARRRARHRQVALRAGARPTEGDVRWISSVSSARFRSTGRQTPQFGSRSRRARRRRWPLAVAIAAAAVAAAFAVPQSRGAILRFFHLGADTIQVVDTLPHARASGRSTPGSARSISTASARRVVHTLLLPPLDPPPPLHYDAGQRRLHRVRRTRGNRPPERAPGRRRRLPEEARLGRLAHRVRLGSRCGAGALGLGAPPRLLLRRPVAAARRKRPPLGGGRDDLSPRRAESR